MWFVPSYFLLIFILGGFYWVLVTRAMTNFKIAQSAYYCLSLSWFSNLFIRSFSNWMTTCTKRSLPSSTVFVEVPFDVIICNNLSHMTSTLRGRGVVRQKWDVIGRRGWVANVLDVQSLLFLLLKKIGFAPWPDIMLTETLLYYWQETFLLTLPIDYYWFYFKGCFKSSGYDLMLRNL